MTTAPVTDEAVEAALKAFFEKGGVSSPAMWDAGMRAALEAARPLMADSIRREEWDAWQPIETAPKDGHIIGHWNGYKRPCVMWWNVADATFESWADRNEAPTHWMPLPAAPTAIRARGDAS